MLYTMVCIYMYQHMAFKLQELPSTGSLMVLHRFLLLALLVAVVVFVVDVVALLLQSLG